VPLAVTNAGWPLFGADELRAGQAVSPGFTGQGWHDMLGYTDIPIMSLFEAGRHIATIARQYDLSFFEHWPSDRSGHRGPVEDAAAHLEMIDTAVGGLLDAWDDQAGMLIITSDHGNIEEKNHRQHTRNPVPTILVGAGHEELSKSIHNLADIAPLVRQILLL
jgi:2,3-bisphosphoglycerate-independent phosphoglycerate mutase